MFCDVPPTSKILEGYHALTPSGPRPLTDEFQSILAEADKPKKGGKGSKRHTKKDSTKERPSMAPKPPSQKRKAPTTSTATPKRIKQPARSRKSPTPTPSQSKDENSDSDTESEIRIEEDPHVRNEEDEPIRTKEQEHVRNEEEEQVRTDREVTYNANTTTTNKAIQNVGALFQAEKVNFAELRTVFKSDHDAFQTSIDAKLTKLQADLATENEIMNALAVKEEKCKVLETKLHFTQKQYESIWQKS
ncbi:unnamed protein product [Lactuca virosa]|uniref:Uncharacterized protein n=1 Tax=Lactuca virosa TaxID=75947 RepID=A0AAU9PWI3_9ASTR|nr:unnamed protein product [Lactuca virosa]